jgi:hypothetical protein
MTRTALSLAIAASIAVFAHPALAQDARALFEEGIRASQRGDSRAACDLFERSFKLEPAGGTQLNIAGCQETRGDYVEAYNSFADARARAEKDGKSERVEVARVRMEALAPKVARIVVRPAEPLGPTRRILVDSVEAPSLVERPRAVHPGTHAVAVMAGPDTVWSANPSTSVGTLTELTMPALEPSGADAKKPTPETPTKAPSTSGSSSSQKTIGLVVGGIGIVALGVCGVTGVLAIGKKNSAQDESKQNAAQANKTVDEGRTIADISTVTGIVGGVALVTGVVLFLTAPSGTPSTSSAKVRVSPLIGPTSGAVVTGSF